MSGRLILATGVLPCVLKQTYAQLTQALKWPNAVNELSFFAHHLHNMHSGMLQWQLQQLTSCTDVNCPMPQGTAIMSMLIRLYAFREQLNDLTCLRYKAGEHRHPPEQPRHTPLHILASWLVPSENTMDFVKDKSNFHLISRALLVWRVQMKVCLLTQWQTVLSACLLTLGFDTRIRGSLCLGSKWQHVWCI